MGLWGSVREPLVSGEVERLAQLLGGVYSSKGVTAIYGGCGSVGRDWVGQAVQCHCDDQTVVAAIKGGYCNPATAHTLRCLFFLEASFNILLSAVHVAGVDNGAADSGSRNQLNVFSPFCSQACRESTEITGI